MIPVDRGQHSGEGGQRLPSTASWGHASCLTSSPARLAAVLRMLSPLRVSRCALCTSRSRMASAMVGLAISLVPVLDRQLAGHDRRAAAVPIVDDLQEVAPLIGRQRGEAPVVEDQQIDAREGLEQPCMPAVAACERQRIEQPWHAMIEHRAIVAAGLVAERAGEPTFAERRSGR